MSDFSPDFVQLRKEMVEQQLVERGIRDTAVLAAMGTVPRHLFVPRKFRKAAYHDRALPLLQNQTISQPYIVAKMLEYLKLQATDTVLEIGAGSGYAAAVMSLMVAHVYTIERLPELVEYARFHLEKGRFDKVTVVAGDGSVGLPEQAPFDVIISAAGGPRVPTLLRKQLQINGRLMMPVGKHKKQRLVLITRNSQHRFAKKRLDPVRFVPLIGEFGWQDKEEGKWLI